MLGVGVVKGMLTTFSHLILRKLTIQYPEQQLEMPAWTRGRPRLIYDLDSGDLRCVSCGACAIACPVDVIKIEDHMGPGRKKVLDRFDIDMGGCIECALCVEACPFRALVMAPDFEMGTYDRAESLVFDLHELRIAGTPEVDAAYDHIFGVKRGLARSAAPAPAAPQPAAAPAATRPAGPLPAIEPKQLEGLSPKERAALYKARQQEAGFVPPQRGVPGQTAPMVAAPGAAAPAAQAPQPARAEPTTAPVPPPDNLTDEELRALPPKERAAIYKARQQAAGFTPPRRDQGEG